MKPTLFLQGWVFRLDSCGVAEVTERRYRGLGSAGVAMTGLLHR